jgi:hypothetical protein
MITFCVLCRNILFFLIIPEKKKKNTGKNIAGNLFLYIQAVSRAGKNHSKKTEKFCFVSPRQQFLDPKICLSSFFPIASEKSRAFFPAMERQHFFFGHVKW